LFLFEHTVQSIIAQLLTRWEQETAIYSGAANGGKKEVVFAGCKTFSKPVSKCGISCHFWGKNTEFYFMANSLGHYFQNLPFGGFAIQGK
jgi:hypothetical protein